MDICWDKIPKRDQVYEIYNNVGWSAYTRDLDGLMRALESSLDLLTVWKGPELVGLARTVGDGQTIVYVQDLIVKSSHRRIGIGRAMIERLIEKYSEVRQFVLITDKEDPVSNEFYKSLNLKSGSELGIEVYMRI